MASSEMRRQRGSSPLLLFLAAQMLRVPSLDWPSEFVGRKSAAHDSKHRAGWFHSSKKARESQDELATSALDANVTADAVGNARTRWTVFEQVVSRRRRGDTEASFHQHTRAFLARVPGLFAQTSLAAPTSSHLAKLSRLTQEGGGRSSGTDCKPALLAVQLGASQGVESAGPESGWKFVCDCCRDCDASGALQLAALSSSQKHPCLKAGPLRTINPPMHGSPRSLSAQPSPVQPNRSASTCDFSTAFRRSTQLAPPRLASPRPTVLRLTSSLVLVLSESAHPLTFSRRHHHLHHQPSSWHLIRSLTTPRIHIHVDRNQAGLARDPHPRPPPPHRVSRSFGADLSL